MWSLRLSRIRYTVQAIQYKLYSISILDEDEEKEKIDLTQHLSWEISGSNEDRMQRINWGAKSPDTATYNNENAAGNQEQDDPYYDSCDLK